MSKERDRLLKWVPGRVLSSDDTKDLYKEMFRHAMIAPGLQKITEPKDQIWVFIGHLKECEKCSP